MEGNSLVHAHNWVIEFRDKSRANMYRVLQTVVSMRSTYQEILIADVQGFGRALFLDGIPQSAALDEHVYHETLIHPALVAHPHPKTVFIAGGGEGAVLREILKHNTVERVVMVDIDKAVTDLARTLLKDWHQGLFDDPRVEMINGDALAYLAASPEAFDCIIMDLTDPFEDGISRSLFTSEFFTLVKSHLTEQGVLGMQAETTVYGTHEDYARIGKTLKSHFPSVLPYQSFIQFYGLAWGFAVAGKQDLTPRFQPEVIAQTLHERGCANLKYYDAETHQHMFSLPKYLRDALNEASADSPLNHDEKLVVTRPFS
jgi:spermidine synthase